VGGQAGLPSKQKEKKSKKRKAKERMAAKWRQLKKGRNPVAGFWRFGAPRLPPRGRKSENGGTPSCKHELPDFDWGGAWRERGPGREGMTCEKGGGWEKRSKIYRVSLWTGKFWSDGVKTGEKVRVSKGFKI